MGSKQHIAVLDDHPAIAEGIEHYLDTHETRFQSVVDKLNSFESFVSYLKLNRPGVLILDLNLGSHSGFEALQYLKNKSLLAQITIVVFSMYSDNALIRKCRAGGAHAFVLKTIDLADLFMALENRRSDEFIVLGTELSKAPPSPEKLGLTAREIEVLRLLSMDKTSAQIGKDLSLSTFTIETYKRKLLKKLDVNSSLGLVGFAHKNGLVG